MKKPKKPLLLIYPTATNFILPVPKKGEQKKISHISSNPTACPTPPAPRGKISSCCPYPCPNIPLSLSPTLSLSLKITRSSSLFLGLIQTTPFPSPHSPTLLLSSPPKTPRRSYPDPRDPGSAFSLGGGERVCDFFFWNLGRDGGRGGKKGKRAGFVFFFCLPIGGSDI